MRGRHAVKAEDVPVLYVTTLDDNYRARGKLPNGDRYQAIAGDIPRLRARVHEDLTVAGVDTYALVLPPSSA